MRAGAGHSHTASKRLQRAIEYLHTNYTTSIRLQDLAEMCGREASNFRPCVAGRRVVR